MELYYFLTVEIGNVIVCLKLDEPMVDLMLAKATERIYQHFGGGPYAACYPLHPFPSDLTHGFALTSCFAPSLLGAQENNASLKGITTPRK